MKGDQLLVTNRAFVRKIEGKRKNLNRPDAIFMDPDS